MNIEKIQKNLEMGKYGVYQMIIQFVIDAIFDYPKYDLVSMSIDKYIDEVKNEIGCSELTLKNIELYLDKSKSIFDENDIWKHSSISTLYEALYLMEIKDISLKKILDIILSE